MPWWAGGWLATGHPTIKPLRVDQVYQTLILAHLGRDSEVSSAILRSQQSITARKADNKPETPVISRLRSEPNLPNAIRIFQAADKARVGISPYVYVHLLHGCVRRSDRYTALKVLVHLEKEHGSRIPAGAHYHIMQLYSETNNLAAAEAFSEFKKAVQLGNVSYESFPASRNLGQHPAPIGPWNLMIRISFRAGRQTEALTILETILDSSDPSIPHSSLSEAEGVVISTDANTFFGRAASLVGQDDDTPGHL